MSCLYCDFASGDGGKTMEPELINQAITGWVDWVRNKGGKLLELHFFGGEPFTQPELIEIAIHRTRFLAEKHDLTMHVEASTNGLLSNDMLSFVKDYFDTIVLSLDGQEEDHDRHRPLSNGTGSFTKVLHTAETLSDSNVNLRIRCCISQFNVEHLMDTTIWLCQTFFPESITFETMKSTPKALNAGLKPPEPLEFARGFINALRIARNSGVNVIYAALYDQPRRTFCPVGRDTFIVGSDRSVRSCYLRKQDWASSGLEMTIGNVTTRSKMNIDTKAVERLRTDVNNRPRCKHCFCRWGCAGGCIVTETYPGHSLKPTDFCRQTRLIQACVLLEQLERADIADQLLSDEDAISRIWNTLDDRLIRLNNA